ncbi:hypothetical protein Sjap_010368 [Stephania japonica]|uniref:Uncharacterized protein n=1 Tax=Stephania japonica TaxID=461633 RepID=A0AAP0P727_9MAGN
MLVISCAARPSVPKTIRPGQVEVEEEKSLFTTITCPRRDVVLLSLLSLVPSLAQPPDARSISFGISGPKEWLREQKRKASRFLIAPIDASRESLRAAYAMLTATDSQGAVDSDEIQRLMKSAARDCVVDDRNSFVSFQANTGVEVCTFSLIVKNASSLLDDKDPIKLEAEATLTDLVRSLTSLDGVTKEADLQLASSRQKVAESVNNAISSLDKFEQIIKNCLEV